MASQLSHEKLNKASPFFRELFIKAIYPIHMNEEESKEMEYGMLGDDQMSQEEKVAKYTGDVDWEYLKPHFKAGAMIYVDPVLELKEVAQAFTDDNKDKVAAWMKKADLVKPGPQHAEWWEYDKSRFTAVVVNPFVLAQPLEKDSDAE